MSTRYIYGRHPVHECLRAEPSEVQRLYLTEQTTKLENLVRLAEHEDIPIEVLTRKALDKLVEGAPHQGVVATVAAFDYATLESMLQTDGKPAMIVVLDQIQDPQNLGSLIRSALALGADGLVYAKDRACDITGAVTKSSAGATTHLPICRVTNLKRALDQLKKAGLWVVGTAPDAPQPLSQVDLRQPIAIVVGSEGRGMRKTVAEACDFLAHIPMAQDGGKNALGSLNASVAGAITLYEAARQRSQG